MSVARGYCLTTVDKADRGDLAEFVFSPAATQRAIDAGNPKHKLAGPSSFGAILASCAATNL